MTEKMDNQKLVQVKLELAKKYERLARTCHSRPHRTTLLHHAGSYRDQAADIARRVK